MVADKQETIILTIFLLVLVLFLFYILYLLISTNFSLKKGPYTGLGPTTPCNPGDCATNIISGQKRCPVNPQISVQAILGQEVCNPPFACTSPITPFAVQSDGSTNNQGQCEPNTICDCKTTESCPIYVRSLLTQNAGNPFDNLATQRIVFTQSVGDPPMTSSGSFCSAPYLWLPYMSPGCGFTNNISYDNLVLCMNQGQGCTGAPSGSPCSLGVLALITDNPESVNKNNLQEQRFACVNGVNCPCGQINIYDTLAGKVVCATLE